MFKTIITITYRSLFRQGIFPIINILGLSIGLAIVLLMSLLNFYERSFDKGFNESKNIYRVNAVADGEIYTSIANALAPAMREIPEVVTTVRTINRWIDMEHNGNPLKFNTLWADEDFFVLFDTPFIHGRPEDVMARPNVIALSETEAKRVFGDQDPMGQMLNHTVWKGIPPMEVVAVFKDYPKNSSLSGIKSVAAFMHNYEMATHRQLTWIRAEFETFCLLLPNSDIKTVNAKIQKIVSEAIADQHGNEWNTELQRLTEIHLYSKKYTGRTSLTNMSDIGKVNMLTLLSVIILLVACVNYMNLSTARAQKRSKEIGISKTIGAKRIELILRLTVETAIFTFISIIIAFILAWGFLPVFNNLTGEQMSLELALQPLFLSVVLVIWIVTTLFAAAYPALYISSFPPLTAIRTAFIPNSSHAIVRKVLIVGQFAVAIALISWTLIIQEQIKYVFNKDLGYNPSKLIGLWIHDSNPAVLDEFRAQSSVEILARENRLGNFMGDSENLLFRDKDDPTGFPLRTNVADPDYFDVMQMKMIAGSTYPEMQFEQLLFRDTIVDGKSYMMLAEGNITPIVLNRAAVDYLGITPEEAIGKKVIALFNGQIGEPVISGVIQNYHYESLHRTVGGVCIHYGLGQPKRYLLLRVVEGNLSEQLKTYEEIFKKYYPNHEFLANIIEDGVARLYDGERRTVRLAVVFSILAIFIACMGVFGLTAYMAEQRTKEIGIRKVMGAGLLDIVNLFVGNNIKLLCFSLLIAFPVAWWVGVKYLQNFAYSISLSWWIFVVAALITVVITLLTVGALAVKAAVGNTVEALKQDN